MPVLDLDEEKENTETNSDLTKSSASAYVARDKVQKELRGKGHPVQNVSSPNQPVVKAAKPVNAAIATMAANLMAKAVELPPVEAQLGLLESFRNYAVKKTTNIANDIRLEISDFKEGLEDLTYQAEVYFRFTRKLINSFIDDVLNAGRRFCCKCKNLAENGIKSISNLFKKESGAAPSFFTRSQALIPQRDIAIPFLLNKKEAPASLAPSQPANQYLNDSEDSISGPVNLFKKIQESLETIVSAFSREKEKEHKEAIVAEVRQKEIQAEAEHSYHEALLLRPDLAHLISIPDVSFLASSPFAKVPDAKELIEKAEAILAGQIH